MRSGVVNYRGIRGTLQAGAALPSLTRLSCTQKGRGKGSRGLVSLSSAREERGTGFGTLLGRAIDSVLKIGANGVRVTQIRICLYLSVFVSGQPSVG